MKERQRPREDFFEAELGLALRGTGCPVCALARETERAVVSWLATTNIYEEGTITKLIDARGLCATHWAGVLGRRGGDLGASGARLLSRIADAAADDLAAGVVDGAPPCPVCVSVERRERSVLGMLFAVLAEPDELAAHQLSPGLCRSHLAMAVDLRPERTTLQALIASQRRSLVSLAERARRSANDARERSVVVRRIIALLAGSGSGD